MKTDGVPDMNRDHTDDIGIQFILITKLHFCYSFVVDYYVHKP